jgi:hypothetical protein
MANLIKKTREKIANTGLAKCLYAIGEFSKIPLSDCADILTDPGYITIMNEIKSKQYASMTDSERINLAKWAFNQTTTTQVNEIDPTSRNIYLVNINSLPGLVKKFGDKSRIRITPEEEEAIKKRVSEEYRYTNIAIPTRRRPGSLSPGVTETNDNLVTGYDQIGNGLIIPKWLARGIMALPSEDLFSLGIPSSKINSGQYKPKQPIILIGFLG